MKMQLVLDLDDTLFDWGSQFDKYLRTIGYKGENVQTSNKRLVDLIGPEYHNLVESFNSSKEFGNLGYFRGSEALNSLDLSGIDVYFISSCGNSDVTHNLRNKNIQKRFPTLSYFLYTLPLFSDKIDLITEIMEKGIIFDDDVRNIRHFNNKENVTAVCMKSAFHNSEGLITVDSFDEFRKLTNLKRKVNED